MEGPDQEPTTEKAGDPWMQDETEDEEQGQDGDHVKLTQCKPPFQTQDDNWK